MRKTIFLLLVLFSVTFSVHAQEISVTDAQVPQKAAFAQPFEAVYTLSHSPDYDVAVDEKTLPADFEITQAVFTRQTPQSGQYRFTVLPFTLNKSTFTLTFLLQQNGQTAAQVTNEQPIEIARVPTFNDKKLREIRAPRIPFSWLPWMILAAFIAGIIYLIKRLTRKPAEKPLAVRFAPDNRPCDEIALSQIDALLDSGLWERKEYKVFYITLSDILREYLWRRFQADTSADTSVELLRRVKHIPALQPFLPKLKEFLNSSDLVKFAKLEPEEPARNRDIGQLREIVQGTAPEKDAPAKTEERV